MTGKLKGRVGIVTGSARGIGRAGALLFAKEGATLGLLDVDEHGGKSVVNEIRAEGGESKFFLGDCADSSVVSEAVDSILRTYGKLDLLWSNAGIGVSKTAPETTLEEWNRVLSVNLTGAFLLAKFGLPRLSESGGGTMVITGSANSFVGDRRWAAYCATKGGLLMLAKAMALDHAVENTRINIVCPGSVTTELHQAWLRGRSSGSRFEQLRAEDMAAHPMNRVGTPEEVARAALFLSCDDSSFITGTALSVDGGVTAQ